MVCQKHRSIRAQLDFLMMREVLAPMILSEFEDIERVMVGDQFQFRCDRRRAPVLRHPVDCSKKRLDRRDQIVEPATAFDFEQRELTQVTRIDFGFGATR